MTKKYLHTVGALLGAIGYLALTAGVAEAQGAEDHSRYVRESCARSRDVVAGVRSVAFDTTTLNALAIIGKCRHSAGAAVPRLWNLDITESRALAALIAGSRGVRDQRIFAAAARVAQDPSRPRGMRQAALIVITSYVKPNLGAMIGGYNRPGSKPELAVYPTMMSHGNQEEGEQAVPQNVRVRVEEILQGLVSAKHGALEDLARLLLAELSA